MLVATKVAVELSLMLRIFCFTILIDSGCNTFSVMASTFVLSH